MVHVGRDGFTQEGGTNHACEEQAREAGCQESLTSGETFSNAQLVLVARGARKSVTGGDTIAEYQTMLPSRAVLRAKLHELYAQLVSGEDGDRSDA